MLRLKASLVFNQSYTMCQLISFLIHFGALNFEVQYSFQNI